MSRSIRQTTGSCTTCSKAKSKCVRRPESRICERCMRLKKDCNARQPIERMRKAAMITRTTQLKNLEEKLDDIAKALVTKETQNSSFTSTGNAPSHQNHHQRSNTNGRSDPITFENLTAHDTPSSPMALQPQAAARNSCNEHHLSLEPLEEELLFDRFQRLMAPHFPFIVIPHDLNSLTLAKSNPFLAQAISVVAFFHDTTRQEILAKDLMRQLYERVFLKNEKSLDALQGALLFAAWFNPHLFQTSSHNNLLHIVMALIRDLEIDRAPGFCEKVMMEAATQAYGIPQPAKTISNEERRAVLGTFYTASTVFTSFRKADVMRWTQWLSECISILEIANEYESDTYLVQLVQSQRTMQEAMSISKNEIPAPLSRQFLQERLASTVEASIIDRMANVLSLQQACARVSIWERSLTSLDDSNVILGYAPPNKHDAVSQCMEAAKHYINTYMEIPVESYPLIPFAIFAHFAYMVVVIMRASFLESESGTAHIVWSEIDVSAMMEKAAQKYDAVSRSQPGGITLVRNEGFANWATKIRWMKAYYDTKTLSQQRVMMSSDPIFSLPFESTYAEPIITEELETSLWDFNSHMLTGKEV